jgi:hypothetical protein
MVTATTAMMRIRSIRVLCYAGGSDAPRSHRAMPE